MLSLKFLFHDGTSLCHTRACEKFWLSPELKSWLQPRFLAIQLQAYNCVYIYIYIYISNLSNENKLTIRTVSSVCAPTTGRRRRADDIKIGGGGGGGGGGGSTQAPAARHAFYGWSKRSPSSPPKTSMDFQEEAV
jgi:hypothetical protein